MGTFLEYLNNTWGGSKGASLALGIASWWLLRDFCAAATTSSLNITLTSGTFRGVANANGTDSSLGIPFAQPPVGNLRFKAPLPITQPLPGIQDASRFGDACQQPPSASLSISENCLFLNVWRPTGTPVNAKTPALVWFHGGAFMIGAASSPSYDPTRIIDFSMVIRKPIVFVSINYRLNTFGFLASADVPAEDLNAGLLDQRAALEFIQDNIACFGGDPAKVTIWGEPESAGAGSVQAQMLYPTKSNLFRAVIADSSTGPFKNAPYVWQYDKPGMPYSRLLSATGCSAGPDSVKCLQNVPYETLLNVSNTMIDSTLNHQLWQPAIGPEGSFPPERPSERILSGKYLHMPYLGGTNLNEGTLPSQAFYNLGLSSSERTSAFNDWMLKLLVDNSTLLPDVIDSIDNFYPVNDSTYGGVWRTGDMLFDRAAAWYTDTMYLAPRRFFFEHGASLQPMFGYHFTEFISGTPPALGVYHASELFFLFGPVPDPKQAELASRMMAYWIHFVHDMNPGPDWPPYDPSSRYVMQLMRDNMTLIPDEFSARRIG